MQLFVFCILTMVFVSSLPAFADPPANLSRMPGVIVLADSENIHRWGIDGYHAANLRDGREPTDETECWASDNWEVTHTAALVFPVKIRASTVVLRWWKKLAPQKAVLQGLQNNQWIDLAHIQGATDAEIATCQFAPVVLEAVRLAQPPDGANPQADRRLWLAELEVHGEATSEALDASAIADRLKAEMRSLRAREDAERVKPQIDLVMRQPKPRGFMGIIDREDVKRGRENAARRPWAKALAESIVKDADWWTAQPDDYLRSLIPEGNPRALCPQFEKGCPIHGGRRGDFETSLETPYRWRCRRGGEWWYDGATVQNPSTGETVTVRDNGSGWLAPPGFPDPGRRYFFVAAYRYFLLGKLFSTPYEPDSGDSRYQGGTPIVQLSLAFALTEDKRYADKAAVLLSRLADLYPTYNGCVEGPTQRQDGYIGQTFERFLVQNIILACDLIWDTLDESQRTHLQRNLLGYIYEYLHRLMPYFDGDFIMYEMTALAALGSVLGNSDIIAEALESDTGLRVMLVNSWFRDGKFIYDSTGYNLGNAYTPLLTAEWLHGVTAPPRYPEPLDLYNDSVYRMGALFDFIRYVDCDGRVPQIGDTGGSRGKSLRETPPYDTYDERAYLRIPDRRDFYAARLDAASGGDLESFRKGRADWWLLFHAGDVEKPAATEKASVTRSHLFTDSGIAILRAGRLPESRQHVALTFSKGSYGHGHPDKLALNILRYGYDLTADLGYPTTWTDIKYGGWESNTASHCTVMLDGKGQTGHRVGALHYYAETPLADVVEASAEKAAYPQASLYRRTVAQVNDEKGEPLYLFDVFRVAGAAQRDYLFHSLGKPENLKVALQDPAARWVSQPQGSLAGANIEPMTAGGYGFLFDVERAETDRGGAATWRGESGGEQGDHYLLTHALYRDFIAEFTITRTGKASGKQERALFAYSVDAANPDNRRTFFLDAGGNLPVGRPVRVRIEIKDGQAAMTMDGQPVAVRADAVGNPPDSGSVGFLHYYNYAYDYDGLTLTPAGGSTFREDFSRPLDPQIWRIGSTYRAEDGKLLARDSETVGLALHFIGEKGREVIRAKGEGYGVRGQAPLEGHLILRERAHDSRKAGSFISVIETYRSGPQVTAVEKMKVAPETGHAVAVRVRAGDRTDYLLSALDARPRTAEIDGMRIACTGRFGLVATRSGRITGMSAVDGEVSCQGKRIASPKTVQGKILSIDIARSAFTVKLTDSRRKVQPGTYLLIRNERFITPAVYRAAKVETVRPGLFKITTDMPFTLARGTVARVDAANGAFASRTSVMKLRVNPGLFDGKYALSALTAPAYRLHSASEQAFVLKDQKNIVSFRAGKEYIVSDIGPGDSIEVIAGIGKRFTR